MKPLVLASNNPHKLEEYEALLPGIGFVALGTFPGAPDVDENAPDFEGNAILKAQSAHAHTGRLSLADDSGIAVDALGGAPGVYSARYAPGSDADRVVALLAAMENQTQRSARFVCALALAGLPSETPLPDGLYWRDGCVVTRGVVEGSLLHQPRGTHGFGYDPIFVLPTGQTTAELSAVEKHAISHRGHATRQLEPLLRALFKK